MAKDKQQASQLLLISHRWLTLMKWYVILAIAIALVYLIILKPITWIIHKMFDGNIIQRMNDKTMGFFEIFTDKDNLKTDHWGQGAENHLLFDFSHFLNIAMTGFVILAMVYGIFILFRHRYGEHQPFIDDLKSKRLKRKIITSLNSKYNSEVDENKKNVKKVEKKARRQIRKARIYIYTTYNRNASLNHAIQYYYIGIKWHRVDAVNEVIRRMTKNMKQILLTKEPGANFGDQQDSENYGYIQYTGQRTKKQKRESLFVRWRRRQKQSQANEENMASEYTFDAELFGRPDDVEEKKEQAQMLAKQYESSINTYLASSGVNVERAKEPYVSSASIQYLYKLPSYVSKLPRTEELESGLESSLGVRGVLVKLAAGNLDITLPLEEKQRIPIDMVAIVEEIF